MEPERLLGGLTMTALGFGVALVGWLGRRCRLDFALGGWTCETASPESWRDTHRTIGGALIVAGAIAVAAGVAAWLVPVGAVGPVVVVGALAMVVPVIFGVVRGLGRLLPG